MSVFIIVVLLVVLIVWRMRRVVYFCIWFVVRVMGRFWWSWCSIVMFRWMLLIIRERWFFIMLFRVIIFRCYSFLERM